MTVAEIRSSSYEPTSLVLDPDLVLDEYLEICASLGAITRGHQWWIGDALVQGEERFGEDFAQGEAELRIEPRTAANYRYVSDRVAVSRRREDLSWSHHAEIARLKASEQKTMLKRAFDEDWTVRQLRDAVALEYPPAQGEQPPLPSLGPVDDVEANRAIANVEDALEQGLSTGDLNPSDVRVVVLLARRSVRG